MQTQLYNANQPCQPRKRIETFRKKTGTRKAIQIIFVVTYGVEANPYSGIVQKQVVLDDLFKKQDV